MSASTFGALGVPTDLDACLRSRGIDEPFPIQQAVIPDALAGRDVIGRAPTGSGKTLAFGLPLVANLRGAAPHRPTALVLAPTRELAAQIAAELRPLATARRHEVVAVFGGVGYGPQRKTLAGGAEVVVACPGRLEDLLAMRALRLDDVRQVVVDEADRMADMGFLPAVRRLLALTHQERQVQLFSATLDGAVAKLSAAVQQRPVRHDVGPATPEPTNTRHAFWSVERAEQNTWVAEVVRKLGATMVFCRTRHGADRVAKQLNRLGVTAAPLHGGRSQVQRDRALSAFAQRTVTTLVATDVAARGIHVDDVAAVVHYDPPADTATFLHRSGRTARAGASGHVLTFVAPGTERDARALQRKVGLDVPVRRPDVTELHRASRRPAPHGAAGSEDRADGAVRTRPRRAGTPAGPSRETGPDAVASTGGRSERSAEEVRLVKVQGKVKFFDADRGFGFISRDGGEDVFVHVSNIRAGESATLAVGQSVEFEIGPGRKSDEAKDVRAV